MKTSQILKRFASLAVVITLFITLGSFTASAQNKQNPVKFNILEAKLNNVDATDWYLKAGAYTVFYISDDGSFCMANVCPNENSQSYGPISMWEEQVIPETENSWEANIFSFRWSYRNSYDTKTGSAMCQLVKIYKPNAVIYELKIVTESMDTLLFKGYMDGSVDKLFK